MFRAALRRAQTQVGRLSRVEKYGSGEGRLEVLRVHNLDPVGGLVQPRSAAAAVAHALTLDLPVITRPRIRTAHLGYWDDLGIATDASQKIDLGVVIRGIANN